MADRARLDPGALAYETVADRYEAGRPGYQEHLVDRVRELFAAAGGDVVLDLAAGTGKFTRTLLPNDADVLAIEPVAAMASQLVRVIDGARAVRGVAGALPLADSSVSGVSVAQAFQWFDAEDVFEIARVLQPGGVLALVWNNRQDTGDWRTVSDVLAPHRRREARAVDAVDRLQTSERFMDVHVETWAWTRTLSREQLHDHIASLSWVAALEPDESVRVHSRIDEEFGSRSTHELDYVSELVWAHRRSG